ncbi:MAG: phosphoribosylanthranilate isomerase [Nitrospinae bacterium]|nr:phosphoribosylanthranilate isomerase [Nitrospinota bacterium]
MDETKVKLCGQTRREDIAFSFASGADFCGVVIEVPSSPRSRTVEQAAELFAGNNERIFALTADAPMALYAAIAKTLKPGYFQLTANEPPEDVKKIRAAFGIPVFKSLHLPREGIAGETAETFVETMLAYLSAGCEGFVLDTLVPGMYGGSGKKSDWELARKIVSAANAKTLLAGGISPENAAQAAAVGAYGIDLASGVETAPGVKSREKIAALFAALGRSTP